MEIFWSLVVGKAGVMGASEVVGRSQVTWVINYEEKKMCIKHSWAKLEIVLVRKLGRKFYYFMAKFQGSGFSFSSLNQNIKVVVFPSNFWFKTSR